MTQTHFRDGPDANGLFGAFGGRYVAETLMPLVLDLNREYEAAKNDPAFLAELAYFQSDYIGRPNPLYFAERLTEYCGGAKIYFKREELNHTGAHKINNCIGQVLLAKRMGKKRLIAETGAGMHGVATATVAARFGLPCVIYMGATDIERQQANVFRMKLLGAEIVPVTSGTGTLKDAMNDALRDWVTNVDDTFYLIGTVAGPHPYPAMVRDFQSIIGKEPKSRCRSRKAVCQTAWWRASVAAPTPWACSTRSWMTPASRSSVSKPPVTAWTRASTRPASTAAFRAYCTATAPTCCKTQTVRSTTPTRSRRAWTTPASARSTLTCTK